LFRRSVIRMPLLGSGGGGGPYPIIVSDASHLWRQYRIVLVRWVSSLAFSKALRLLSSMVSCACVWIIVGRLGSTNRFPRPRPRPALIGGVVWLFSTLAGGPPMPLASPSGARYPRPLPPQLPYADPLSPARIPPLHLSRILECGSWWSPFSIPVRSA